MSSAARRPAAKIAMAPRLTRTGLGAACLAFGVLFAGVNTGNNLFHLLFAVTVAAFAVNLVVARGTLRRMSLDVRPASRGEVGRPLRIEIDAWSGSRTLPLPAMGWRLFAEEGEADPLGRGITPPAPAGGAARGTARLVPESRGPLAFSRLETETAFPLGLVRARASVPIADRSTLVWPRPLGQGEVARAADPSAGVQERPGRDRGGEAVEARLHRDGDDARAIDWKATARSGRLIVRERRGRPEPTTVIALDRALAGEKFEREVSRAALAAREALARGEAVGLEAGPFSVAPGSGTTQQAMLGDALAVAQGEGS